MEFNTSNTKVCDIYVSKINTNSKSKDKNRLLWNEGNFDFLKINLGHYNTGDSRYQPLTYRVLLEIQAYKTLSTTHLVFELKSINLCFDETIHPTSDTIKNETIRIHNSEQGYQCYILTFKHINTISYQEYLQKFGLKYSDINLILNHILKVNQAGVIVTNCTPENLLIELENSNEIKNIYTTNLSRVFLKKQASQATDIFTMWKSFTFQIAKQGNNSAVTIHIVNDICQKFLKEHYAGFETTPNDNFIPIRESNEFVLELKNKIPIIGAAIIGGMTLSTIYKQVQKNRENNKIKEIN